MSNNPHLTRAQSRIVEKWSARYPHQVSVLRLGVQDPEPRGYYASHPGPWARVPFGEVTVWMFAQEADLAMFKKEVGL